MTPTPVLPRSSMDAGAIREAIVKTFMPELLGAGDDTTSNVCETWIQILADLTDQSTDTVRRDLIGDASRRAGDRVQVAPLFRVLARQMHLRDDADMLSDEPAVEACERACELLVDAHLTGVTAKHMADSRWGAHDVRLVFERSDEKELQIDFEYRHLDGGRTSHTLFVRPSMTEPFDLRVGGRNRSNIKPLLKSAFGDALRKEVEYR